MSRTMSASARQDFLAEPRVGVLAVERPGRAPLAVPVWYGYEPGGEVLVWTLPGVKEQLVRAAGRFTITVQSEQWPYRYVSAEGPVHEVAAPAPLEAVVAISARYLGEEEGRQFAEASYAPNQALIRMRPERWLSTDFSDAGSIMDAGSAYAELPG